MEKFEDYVLQEKIHETKHSIIYRGHKKNESQSFIIKLLNTNHSTPSEIARFRREYGLIKNVDIKGVIKTFDIINYEDGFALIEEDSDNISIKSYLDKKEVFDLNSLLKISADIAGTLGNLHAKGVIHRGIKPGNLLINPITEDIKITNFGISAILTHENDEVYNPDFINSTLAYMSPEQTGRMNRTVDYRTDLYSIGITLYEIFTGFLPFKSGDPMELIHSHIAIMPLPPVKLNSRIPIVVSDIIMRLLEKNPESRYQNGFGLEADFKQCLKQLNEKKKIESFELGKHDISNKFIIPQKLFGREKEIGELISSFEDVANSEQGVSVMVVAGAPGIGKSAMINEIHKPIVAKRGYFISGKYEQFRREKPYSAIIQAFQILVKQILSESEARISVWKDDLLKALSDSGKIITDVIPEVELIIGKQTDLPVLGPEESKNRFNFVFEKFMRVFPQKEHPVTLFLDDLQWADMASLQLMKNIMLSGIHHLFIIFSYRDNEVDETHPVIELLQDVQKHHIHVDKITLGPLKKKEVTDLIVNFLRCSEERGFRLAELVQEKAGGNPFFVNQFLHTLYNEKMIVHKGVHGWQWDVAEISRMKVTDNLLQMMAGKIGKLSPDTQEVLKICACIGNRFDLETLASVRDTSVDSALGDLTEAIREGMVSRVGDFYVFHHDRIHEAAYSLVSNAEKSALHYKIGKLAHDTATDNERKNKLFYIVDQLNLGVKMITDSKERERLALLNFDAGIKAKDSAAYNPSFHYLQTGIDLLDKDSWNSRYDLTLAIYTESVEVCYLLGDFNKMNGMADIAIKNAKNVLDKGRIYFNMINSLKAQRDYVGAINMALPMLREFGIKFPKNPSKIRVVPALFRTMIRLRGVTSEDLINMHKPEPENEEEIKLIVMGRILATLGHAAFFINPNLFGLVTMKGINLSLKRNQYSEDIPFAIAAFGVIRLAAFGNIDGAYKLANMGLKMAKALNLRKMESRIYFIYNMLIRHWKEPLKNSIEPGLEGHRIGKETGDLEYAAWNLQIYATVALLAGVELPEFEREISKHNKIIYEMNQDSVGTLNSEVWQFVLGLLDRTEDPLRIKGEVFDEDEIVPKWIKEKNRPALAVFYDLSLFLKFIFNEYSLALKDSSNYSKYRDTIIGSPPDGYFYLFDSFARLYSLSKVSWLKRRIYLAQVRINRWKIKRWAGYSPQNKLQSYYAVNALWEMVVGKNIGRALAKAELLIKTAREHNDIIIEAVANEMTGRYILSIDEKEISKFFLGRSYKGAQIDNFISSFKSEQAKKYITASYYCYSRWGATAKLKQLRKLYPNVLGSLEPLRKKADDSAVATTNVSIPVSLDISSVLKASQAISGEIVLKDLLSKMMRIIMENAGAQKGFMILADRDRLLVEAEGSSESEDVTVLESIPVESHKGLSAAIVNYVYRSGKDVILGNAVQEGHFTNDDYIMRTHCKSILCTPIKSKGALAGILYMENNLTDNAFTPERIEPLRIISSQVAISIENARLFKLATSLENIQDGYFEIDLAGNYTFFNNAVCQIHGYSKEELMGMNNRQYEDEETAKKVYKAFNNVYKTGDPLKGLDSQIIRKDGTKRYVEGSISLLKDSSGEPFGFSGIVRDITERKQLEEKLHLTLESLSKAYDSTLHVMVSAVEVRDPYTVLHQIRSADIARDIATEMGLAQEKIDAIRIAAAIHDIGKLSIPPEILTKPTKLTGVEFALIKEHSRSGYEILKNVESPWPLAQIVHQHHERMNGSGYPRNLKGDEILLEARILAVADVMSSMVSNRYHRPSLGIEAALEEIEKNKGILYDDDVVDACVRLFREKGYKLT